MCPNPLRTLRSEDKLRERVSERGEYAIAVIEAAGLSSLLLQKCNPSAGPALDKALVSEPNSPPNTAI
jgi:hypothetical protein